ncbi:Uncharacterised protein [Chlamydia trachomatis]|nr:Uncharacterised protein [Chlamydia trachomatis]
MHLWMVVVDIVYKVRTDETCPTGYDNIFIHKIQRDLSFPKKSIKSK